MNKKALISSSLVLTLLASRRQQAKIELDNAIAKKEWSKVPGWDGIDIGLMMAEKIVNECKEGKR